MRGIADGGHRGVAGSGSRDPRSRRAALLARGDGHRVRGLRRARRRSGTPRRPHRRRSTSWIASSGELSRFLPNSDITRINHLAAGESTRVGADDAGVPGDRAAHVRPDRRRVRRRRSGPGCPRSSSTPTNALVRATTEGVRLDLGGIGKGYAVDLMAEVLEEWGLSSARSCTAGFSSVLALERAGRPRRLAADAERSRRALPGARPACRCARRLSARRACARAITSWIRAPAHRSAGGSRRGWRCRGPASPAHCGRRRAAAPARRRRGGRRA